MVNHICVKEQKKKYIPYIKWGRCSAHKTLTQITLSTALSRT